MHLSSSFCHRTLDQAFRNGHGSASSGLELLIQEWGTMEEWGHEGRHAKPTIKDLLDLCRKIDNYRAASYINHEILGGKLISKHMYIHTYYAKYIDGHC